MSDVTYDVKLDNISPEELSEISKWIFATWVAFARGETSLGGFTLKFPTGEYASGISLNQLDDHTYSIRSTSFSGDIIETGHKSFDMKTLGPKTYAMHRNGVYTGRASVRADSPADSWIIPAMPAYEPGRILVQLAQERAAAAAGA